MLPCQLITSDRLWWCIHCRVCAPLPQLWLSQISYSAWTVPQAVSCIRQQRCGTSPDGPTSTGPIPKPGAHQNLGISETTGACSLGGFFFFPPLLRIILPNRLWMACFVATMMVAAECWLEDVASGIRSWLSASLSPFYIAHGQQEPQRNYKALYIQKFSWVIVNSLHCLYICVWHDMPATTLFIEVKPLFCTVWLVLRTISLY